MFHFFYRSKIIIKKKQTMSWNAVKIWFSIISASCCEINQGTKNFSCRWNSVAFDFPAHFRGNQTEYETKKFEKKKQRLGEDLLFAFAEGFVEDVRVLLDLSYSDHVYALRFSFRLSFVFLPFIGVQANRLQVRNL